jgi:hypothetical protein
MAEPTLHLPRKWRDSEFGRRYFIAGWQDAVEGRAHAYFEAATAIALTIDHGRAALQPYDDGYKAGQAARE